MMLIKKYFQILSVVLFTFLGLLDFSFAEDSRTKTFLRIEEINIQGVTSIPIDQVQKELPVTVGSAWKESFTEEVKAKMKEFFELKGFLNSNVQVIKQYLTDEKILLIVKVKEGTPCTVEEFNYSEPFEAIQGKANQSRFRKKMLDVLKMKAGDRYDESLLADQLRSLKEFLAKEDFILVNTDQVRLRFNEDKTKVKVSLDIQYGDRVSFGFIGNDVFSKSELNEFIFQLKQTNLGKDYIGIIVRKMTDEYKARAYNFVEIKAQHSETSRGKHVTFVINEGERQHIKSIKIDGVSTALSEGAYQFFYKGSSRLVERNYFVEKDVDSGIQAVLEYLKSNGFLSAKLISKNIIQQKDKKVTIDILFLVGEQSLVNSVQISGGNFYTKDEYLNVLKLSINKPFNPYLFEESLQQLRVEYVAQGFLYSKVATDLEKVVTFEDHNRRVNITVDVQEGQRIKIGHVRVEGLKKTKPYVVDREIDLAEGEWWLSSRVYSLEDHLKRLGIFADVKIKPYPSKLGPEYRDAAIEIVEAEPGVLEFGPGFRSDLGLRGFARISYGNLFGRNQTVTLSAESNRRLGGTFHYRFLEYNIQSVFLDPRLFSTRNAFTAGLSTAKRQFIDFNAVQTQFFAGLERKLFWPQVTGKLTYRLERIRQFGAVDAVDNQTLLIGSITPALIFDTRDNPFTATKGQITTLSVEYALPYFVGQDMNASNAVGYSRWQAATHVYTPIFKDIVWSNVVALGYIRNNIAENQVPLIKTFRLGGYASVRGFAEDSINVDRFQVKGDLALLNLRTQVDIPFVGDLRFSPFLDAGNLFLDFFSKDKDSPDRAHYSKSPFLRMGAGAGLHYMTPIGPINFDYGVKLNRRGTEPIGQFHFSVGLI